VVTSDSVIPLSLSSGGGAALELIPIKVKN
jgi:hypothetical protein